MSHRKHAGSVSTKCIVLPRGDLESPRTYHNQPSTLSTRPNFVVMTTLPDLIKIDDIANGKVASEDIYAELHRLKMEVNILRNDMSLFIKALATIPDNQSQQEYHDNLVQKVHLVKKTIKEYCSQYNRLLPIINLTQIKLGQDVEILNGAALVSPQKQPK